MLLCVVAVCGATVLSVLSVCSACFLRSADLSFSAQLYSLLLSCPKPTWCDLLVALASLLLVMA